MLNLGNYILDSVMVSCDILGMKNDIEFPQTLTQAIKYFADPSRGLNFIAAGHPKRQCG
jgi:hypothetical protein